MEFPDPVIEIAVEPKTKGDQEKMGEALNRLAKDGYQKALRDDPNFLAGLNVYKGNVTHKAVADTFGHKYLSPVEALN